MITEHGLQQMGTAIFGLMHEVLVRFDDLSTMRILRDGQWAEVETGFVLKDGVWKPIEEIYKLQDGQWVQA